jgi:hypothetical protein
LVKYEWVIKVAFVISLAVFCILLYFLIRRGAIVLLRVVLLIIFVAVALKAIFHEPNTEDAKHDEDMVIVMKESYLEGLIMFIVITGIISVFIFMKCF